MAKAQKAQAQQMEMLQANYASVVGLLETAESEKKQLLLDAAGLQQRLDTVEAELQAVWLGQTVPLAVPQLGSCARGGSVQLDRKRPRVLDLKVSDYAAGDAAWRNREGRGGGGDGDLLDGEGRRAGRVSS